MRKPSSKKPRLSDANRVAQATKPPKKKRTKLATNKTESSDRVHTQRPARLANVRLRKMAAKHQPPQSWYDEDMEGLY